MDIEKHRAAFALVDPSETLRFFHADKVAKLAEAVSWRDPIAAVVPQERLDHAGVTIEDVKAAILHYTCTDAVVTEEKIGTVGLRDFRGGPGYLVIAAGYRNGPRGGATALTGGRTASSQSYGWGVIATM